MHQLGAVAHAYTLHKEVETVQGCAQLYRELEARPDYLTLCGGVWGRKGGDWDLGHWA